MKTECKQTLSRVINKAISLEKKALFQHNGIKLHASELHLLQVIQRGGENSRNITRIAQHLGVTKGAVSQTLTKLVKKGVVHKAIDTQRKNELILTLTSIGSSMMAQFIEEKAKKSKAHDELFTDFTDEDMTTILRFLAKLESALAEAEQ